MSEVSGENIREKMSKVHFGSYDTKMLISGLSWSCGNEAILLTNNMVYFISCILPSSKHKDFNNNKPTLHLKGFAILSVGFLIYGLLAVYIFVLRSNLEDVFV